jgi:hypothetical protein
MNEQLTPAVRRRAQVLQRYIRAMESGDIDSIASTLSEAEQDQALERMLLEVNEVYQHEDHTNVQPAEVTRVQQIISEAAQARACRESLVDAPSSAEIAALSEPAEVVDTPYDPALNAPPARRAPVQVLPARKIAAQKWYRTPRTWIFAAVAALLIALLLLPAGGALASQILSLFRVQQFQPVKVTQQDLHTLSSHQLPTLADFGSLQVQANSLQTRGNLTEAQAAHMLDFPILLPRLLPRGISGAPDFGVLGSGHATFTFNASRAHAYFEKNGYGKVNIPANLDGATFEITTSAGVMIAYGNRSDTQFMVMELPSPVVRATGKASLQELRDVILSLPGLPPQLVAQLRSIDLSSGMVPLPVPAGVDSTPVKVQGTTGLLLTRSVSTGIQQLKKFPAGSAVVWQMHGIIYAVGGAVSDTNQLLTSANSLR